MSKHEDLKEIARVVVHLADAIDMFNDQLIQDEQPELAQECVDQLVIMISDLKELVTIADVQDKVNNDKMFAISCMVADYDASAIMVEDMVKLAKEQNCPSGYSLYFLKHGLMAQIADSHEHIAKSSQSPTQ